MSDLNGSAMRNSPDSSKRLATTANLALFERWKRDPANLLYWTEAHRVIRERPMVLAPPLHAIYADRHPFLVIRKPSQVGATEFNINAVIHAAMTNYADRGVCLYVLPTGVMAERISQGRFTKAINESPRIRVVARKQPAGLPQPAKTTRKRNAA